MKKTILISIVLASFLLVGCGGGSDSSIPSTDEQSITNEDTNLSTDNSSNTSGNALNSVDANNIAGYKIYTITLSNGIATTVEFKCDGSFENRIQLAGRDEIAFYGDDIEITDFGMEDKAIGVTRVIEFTGISSNDDDEHQGHITLNDSEHIVVDESSYGSSNMLIETIEQVSTCN